MDDNEKAALLAELEAAWKESTPLEDDRIGRAFSGGYGPNHSGNKYSGAVMYLLAKRRYDKAPEPVKTRMSFEEWRNSTDTENPRDAWNAALANAPTGIEIPPVSEWPTWAKAIRVYFSANDHAPHAFQEGDGIALIPRPAPKTVDLTDDENLEALRKRADTPDKAWAVMKGLIITGKTLDELCEQYGVETTRSV